MGNRISPPKITKLIEAQRDSGLTINAFCKKHRIPISTFWYWRKQFSGKTKNEVNSFVKLLPVSIMQPSTVEVKIGSAFICIKNGCNEETIRMVFAAAMNICSEDGAASHVS